MKLSFAITVIAAVCLAGAVQAQHPKPPAKPPAPQRQPLPVRPGQLPPQKVEAAPEPGPGSAEYLGKLLRLTPEQRNKALGSLPPPRRAQIERRLEPYLKMTDKDRAHALEHLRRMQSLPPQKQQQVRASLQRLAAMLQPRKGLVNRQIRQMGPLSDAERRAFMNTEEFRNKFTPAEQQIIEDVSLVTPQT